MTTNTKRTVTSCAAHNVPLVPTLFDMVGKHKLKKNMERIRTIISCDEVNNRMEKITMNRQHPFSPNSIVDVACGVVTDINISA